MAKNLITGYDISEEPHGYSYVLNNTSFNDVNEGNNLPLVDMANFIILES